ncbi:MAG: hypothetical protein KGH96_23560 [Sphingomonadales bacterium]|nr:hypothetical protein [Sphingomonadales bacterium]
MVDFIGMSDPDYKANLIKKAKEELAKLNSQQEESNKKQAEYKELLKDANKSPRLSPWEEDFVHSLLHPPYFSFYAETGIPFNKLTKKQLLILERIKQKVYAT